MLYKQKEAQDATGKGVCGYLDVSVRGEVLEKFPRNASKMEKWVKNV